MVGHEGVGLDVEEVQLASRQGPAPGRGAQTASAGPEHAQLPSCPYWSALFDPRSARRVRAGLSGSTGACGLAAAGCVCLQVVGSWKSEAHGKRVRSWVKVGSRCQPNTDILLDSSSDAYWMLFWKTLFIQGVQFSTQRDWGEIWWLV